MKPYGVSYDYCNMKYTFLCIVIGIACSVCVNGNLEIYPYPGFNLGQEDRRAQLEDENDQLYSNNYNTWPKQYVRNDYEDNEEDERRDSEYSQYMLPETLQLFNQLLNNRIQTKQQHNNRDRFDEYYGTERFQPNLNDVREYSQEDPQDFTFNEDENSGINLMNNDNNYEGAREDMQMNEENVDDNKTPNKLFDVIESDPTEFGYTPSDPRFYETSQPQTSYNGNSGLNVALPPTTIKNIADELRNEKLLQITHRSDQQAAFQNTERTAFTSPKGNDPPRNSPSVNVVPLKPNLSNVDSAGVYIIAVVAGISAAATVGLIAVGIGWYNLQKHVKNASDVEYPAYGVTGPNKDISPSGDRRLAQSAQMYHYQHQKQQILAMENRATVGERHGSVSEADSDEENEEGDYTVYECPGLAPTGEMEVKNPLFQDDPTPAQTPQVKQASADDKK